MAIKNKASWALSLYTWDKELTKHADVYNDKLFELLNNATKTDRFLLAQVYPGAVEVYLQWKQAKTKDAFYNMFPEIRELMRRGGNRIITLS